MIEVGWFQDMFGRRPTIPAGEIHVERLQPPTPSAVGPAAIGAASTISTVSTDRLMSVTPINDNWQAEVWRFYDELGEFRYGIDWRAEMVSRVRLKIGRKTPDSDEPEIVDDGPAVEILDRLLTGAVGGPQHLMRSFATQLGVPGECWLVGEVLPGQEKWRVHSADEIRKARSPRFTWEVMDDEQSQGNQDQWRGLAEDSFVTRVWDPNPRIFHRADSPAKAARQVMRELELVNRHIQALYLSRLASAGLILIPDEIEFPVDPRFADAPNPFMAEWFEAAKTAIQTPGTAAAAVPIPMRGAAAYLEQVRFVDFSMKGDEKILDKRDSAIRRLATQLDLPAEVLLGMGDVNHWSAWQLEESGIKVHVLPMVEKICFGLGIGFLEPMMRAEGEFDPDLVMWYDASEIIMRPDRSEQAIELYDRLEINGEALRRETGLDESDAPSDDELEIMILKLLAREAATAATALKELTGTELEAVASTPAQEPAEGQQEAPEEDQGEGPPGTQSNPPPTPDESEPASRAAKGMIHSFRTALAEVQKAQRSGRHWMVVQGPFGTHIEHPKACQTLQTPCPFDAAPSIGARPGRPGRYEVRLSADGFLRLGRLEQDTPYADQRAQ